MMLERLGSKRRPVKRETMGHQRAWQHGSLVEIMRFDSEATSRKVPKEPSQCESQFADD